MKHFFILLIGIILLGSIDLQAQTDSISTQDITTAERIIDKYSSQTFEFVEDVVNKLEGPSKYVFKSVVRLQIAKGLAKLLPIVFCVVFFLSFKSEYKRIEMTLNSDNVPPRMNPQEGPFDDDNFSGLLILYFIAFILFAIISIFATYSGLLNLIAPEWYAIQEIITLVK